METTRQQKIERMLQKELGEIFLIYARKLNGTIITVTNVRISPDLSIVRTHLSVFPSERSKEILERIKADTRALRYELGTHIRHQMRIVPELYFHIDDSLDYIDNIDKLLKNS
jgi:ribosome-binding factor A